jgi:DNA (cytosine-5)-methyltransferase 1
MTDAEDKFTISDRLWAGHQKRKMQHNENGNGFGYSLFTPDDKYTSTLRMEQKF